ncbi:MAG: twitching motility protein PilT [Thermoplasmata archaeon]|nr:MAG: twitching motility protein PilT [Thermoplasmata archaeon]
MVKEKGIIPVILDTNAILAPFQFKFDLEGELKRLLGAHKILVPSAVLEELKHVSDRHAKAALTFAGRYELVESDRKGDEAILDLAARMGAVVVTNDKELKKRLKLAGITIIYLRQQSYLVLEHP